MNTMNNEEIDKLLHGLIVIPTAKGLMITFKIEGSGADDLPCVVIPWKHLTDMLEQRLQIADEADGLEAGLTSG